MFVCIFSNKLDLFQQLVLLQHTPLPLQNFNRNTILRFFYKLTQPVFRNFLFNLQKLICPPFTAPVTNVTNPFFGSEIYAGP